MTEETPTPTPEEQQPEPAPAPTRSELIKSRTNTEAIHTDEAPEAKPAEPPPPPPAEPEPTSPAAAKDAVAQLYAALPDAKQGRFSGLIGFVHETIDRLAEKAGHHPNAGL